MMVIERTVVVTLDEITALRFRCQQCRAFTSFPIDESINLPVTCVNCPATLYDAAVDGGDLGTLLALPRALKALIRLQASKPFEVLLELHGPDTD